MWHVVEFLRSYLRQHWGVLRHVEIKDSGLGILALLEKWGEGSGAEGEHASGQDLIHSLREE
ncbi:MAG: hypothetical protein HY704_04445 [Gemmatimonadetes bacterium]|nr:hypothetical protein [Gemmatimonadota bacterium]